MRVWKSDEKLLSFASLIFPSKIILFETKFQAFNTVSRHQMKYLEVRQKYSTVRRIFNFLLNYFILHWTGNRFFFFIFETNIFILKAGSGKEVLIPH